MTVDEAIGAAGCPDALRPALRGCLTGELPVASALTRLLIQAESGRALTGLLDALDTTIAPGEIAARRRLQALRRMHAAHPAAWDTLQAVLGEVRHDAAIGDEAQAVEAFARAFDRAAGVSPEASVALHSFGDAGRLALATAEVVRRMAEWGLLGPDRTVLDLGCGIGRFAAALAGRVRRVVGLDISARMVAEARRRCAGLANVEIRRTSGRDLAGIADGSVDTILAADSFPYLVLAGPALVRRHVEEAARVLGPGGHLLILNHSYRGDDEADRRELADLAAETGFRLRRVGTRPFALWDGLAFHLVRGR
ncbi:class I SAM-dependent methyltransferase [Inquilinus sp. Marseille-Q2685]|uniref:class I SAM-dependent methyltransferase n=1 Tax=Inquilinus sp. Marseille-Q2685 TaxID=2866581 RepID=UPI001CE4A6E5|nr:class I SAM-dependent methyltransferase [Inquilinus sp. Marseille-Q2685]